MHAIGERICAVSKRTEQPISNTSLPTILLFDENLTLVREIHLGFCVDDRGSFVVGEKLYLISIRSPGPTGDRRLVCLN